MIAVGAGEVGVGFLCGGGDGLCGGVGVGDVGQFEGGVSPVEVEDVGEVFCGQWGGGWDGPYSMTQKRFWAWHMAMDSVTTPTTRGMDSRRWTAAFLSRLLRFGEEAREGEDSQPALRMEAIRADRAADNEY